MRWKWIGIGIGGLVIVLIIAVYVILTTTNLDGLKPQIAKAAREATGRELTLNGDIRLKVGWTPILAVESVSFQNASWGSRPEMAKIKRFEVEVALIPLISRSIEVKRLILVEPDILIETDSSGKSNLEFETEKKVVPEKPKGRSSREKGDETAGASRQRASNHQRTGDLPGRPLREDHGGGSGESDGGSPGSGEASHIEIERGV